MAIFFFQHGFKKHRDRLASLEEGQNGRVVEQDFFLCVCVLLLVGDIW